MRQQHITVGVGRPCETCRKKNMGIAIRGGAECELLWAEDQGARALRDVGWETVQDAWEAGQEGLAAEVQRQRLLAQAQTWQRLDDSLQDLARQLDALSEERGGSGHVRIRLWERERELGLGL